MSGVEFLFIPVFVIIQIFLSSNYPKELNLEIKRFCTENDGSNELIKKDYFWFMRFSKSITSKTSILSTIVFAVISILIQTFTPNIEAFFFIETIFLLLFITTIVDAKTQMIPDAIPLILVFIGLFFSENILGHTLGQLIFGMFLGYFAMYLVLWLTSVIMQKEAMGVGDVKLISAIGAIIGAEPLPMLLLISSGLALIMLMVMRNKVKKPQFAFGPYISISSFYIIIEQSKFIF